MKIIVIGAGHGGLQTAKVLAKVMARYSGQLSLMFSHELISPTAGGTNITGMEIISVVLAARSCLTLTHLSSSAMNSRTMP